MLSGDVKPGVALYMMRELGMNADEIDHVLSRESGFKGLSVFGSRSRYG